MHRKKNSDKTTLITKTKTCCNERNNNKSKINWNFTKEDAEKRLSKYYTKN